MSRFKVRAERGTVMWLLIDEPTGFVIDRLPDRAALVKQQKALQAKEAAVKACKRLLKQAGFGNWLIESMFKIAGY